MPSPNVDDAGRFMNAAQFQAEYSFMGEDHDKSNVFSDWLYPQDKEMRQLGQQAMLTQMEPQLRMEGMKAAGINPLTAASGIAGSSPSAIPQPSSSVNPIGDVAGALGSVSGAAGDVAGAIEKGALLGVTKDKLHSETIKNLESAGLDHWNALSVAELLPGMKANQRADFYLKLGQLDKVRQEYKNLEAEHNNIIAQYENILADTSLKRSQEELNAARKAVEDENARWQKQQNDFFESHNYAADAPLDVSLRNCVVTGKGSAEQIGQSVEDYHYRSSKGSYRAESEFANEISFARANGQNASDVAYGRIGSSADLAGRIAMMGTDLILSGIGDVKNLFRSGDAKKIRNELRMVLDNLYDQMEKFPEDKERCQKLADDINVALQLNNKELIDWYKKQNE